MIYLGLMKYFLGKQVKQSRGEIFISQEKYADDILKNFNKKDCKSLSTPIAVNEKLSKYDESKKVDEKVYRSFVGSY